MLGRLTRWLRILGHDVVYFRVIDDADLVERARRENRVLLTRDTRLVQRRAARGAVLVESPHIEQQLRQMLRVAGPALLGGEPGRRCPECNERTHAVEKSSVRGGVPPYVYRTQSRFRRCGSCGRIYWRATHVRGMIRRLRKALGSGIAARDARGSRAAKRPRRRRR
jgi:hypothetical protein